MVSAWASRQRLVLGQRACGAIPLLLERLALTGAPGAIDAMATQCRIAPAMREAALAGQFAQRQLRRRTRLRGVVDHGGVRHRREQSTVPPGPLIARCRPSDARLPSAASGSAMMTVVAVPPPGSAPRKLAPHRRGSRDR